MKTPDEIKKGLELKSITTVRDRLEFFRKNGFVLARGDTVEGLCADALALIRQLEAEVKDWRHVQWECGGVACDICKHAPAAAVCARVDCECDYCDAGCYCRDCKEDDLFEWRGTPN